jgi:hypothetical protein
MRKYRRIMFVLMSGAWATAASMVATAYAGGTSTGAWTTIGTTKTVTMTEVLLNVAGQAIINLSSAEVAGSTTSAKRWARFGVVLSGATSVDCAALVLADEFRFAEPWTTIAFGDLATVAGIVA